MGLLSFLSFLDVNNLLEAVGRFLDRYVETFSILQPGDTPERPYMKRWYLLRLRPEPAARHPALAHSLRWVRGCLNVDFYLHRILNHDGDRNLHDHPWPFVVFILSGGYDEYVPSLDCAGVTPDQWTRVPRGAPCVVEHPAQYFHRVQLRLDAEGRPIPSWSLLLRGPQEQDWGFLCEGGKKGHVDYLNELYGEGNWEREPFYYDEASRGGDEKAQG